MCVLLLLPALQVPVPTPVKPEPAQVVKRDYDPRELAESRERTDKRAETPGRKLFISRCALCHDVTTARLAREHNDANVLSIGVRIVGSEVAKDIVRTFLETPFSGEERHARRIEKIAALESR